MASRRFMMEIEKVCFLGDALLFVTPKQERQLVFANLGDKGRLS
jgi:hypothetical protein